MTSSDPLVPHPDSEPVLAWHRANPGFIVLQMLASLRGFVIPIIIVGISSGALGDAVSDQDFRRLGFFCAGLGVFLLISFAWNLLEWRFFRYALAPGRLLVRSGWISRQERSIPYARIQSVDVMETPVYRILRLARLRIETAAGGALQGAEVDIKAIGRDEAMTVREQLLRARQAARGDQPVHVDGVIREENAGRGLDETRADGDLIRALSMRELVIAGATSGTIGPAAAVIGGFLSVADDIIPEAWWRRVPWDEVESIGSSMTVLGILIVVVALLAWLLAIAGTVMTYYGFELRRSDDHLFVQHGLLDKRRATIPVRRIQAIRVEEGILRQPFGYVTVKYSSAGHGGQETGGSGTLFPFMPLREVHDLLVSIAPEFAVDLTANRLVPLPRRSLPRYIVGDTILFAVAVAVFMIGMWYRSGNLPWWAYLPLVLVPGQVLVGWLGYRDAGWRLDQEHVMIRSRSFVRSTMITTRRRLQHRRISANPLQRRARLATLHVAVASGIGGGTTSLAHIDRADGERILYELNPNANV